MSDVERNIIVVDDERHQRAILEEILQDEGFKVRTARDGREALSLLKREPADLILTDQKMSGMDGFSLLKSSQSLENPPKVVLITAFGTIDSAVDAMRMGAFDYLAKPINKDELLITVRQAFEKIDLERQNKILKEKLRGKFKLENIIGSSGSMQEIFQIVRKVAKSNTTVLIRGESGTGKEMIAKAIHYSSPRKDSPMCSINCAAIPDALLESELFGYEKGAFTGADAKKAGLFETANSGTIFLDEIGDLSLPMQAKILRVLQDKEIRHLGGSETVKVDVRIIAATNKNLEKEMMEKKFRDDLYYRLNIVSFIVPPLRERKTDIPLLVEHFLEKHSLINSEAKKNISPKALDALMRYSWPGNVRQLESVIERSLVLCEGEEIGEADLPVEVRSGGYSGAVLEGGMSLEDMERTAIIKAMESSRWIVAEAARRLGVTYRTLQYRLEKFGIKRDELSNSLKQ